jgi:replicative DNA helicase
MESVHTEVAILGAMILDGVAVNDAIGKLIASDFSLDSHQRIYGALLSLMEKGSGIDLIMLRAELDKRRELDSVGGPGYLMFLTEGIPRNFNIEGYVGIVKDKSMLRQILGICHDGQVRAQDSSENALDLLNDIEQHLLEVSENSGGHELTSVPEMVQQSFGSVDKIFEHAGEITGLQTHYTDFDRMTCGLQASELVIIAARPSMGKTALAINIAQNAAVRDAKVVAIFSLEMSKESLFRRMLSSQALVGGRKIQTGFLGGEDKRKIMRGLEELMDSHIFIDDTPGITISEMRARARRLRQRQGDLDLIVVDYLQLMSGGTGIRRGSNRTEEVSMISRGLKILAKELKVPVVALSQLSRASEQRGGDKRPILSDLRESGSIEQDADVVAFIHREEYYDHEDIDLKGKAEIIVAKQRNGPTGTVELAWMSDLTRFENFAKGY